LGKDFQVFGVFKKMARGKNQKQFNVSLNFFIWIYLFLSFKSIFKEIKFFFFALNLFFLFVFLDHFNILISIIIFKT